MLSATSLSALDDTVTEDGVQKRSRISHRQYEQQQRHQQQHQQTTTETGSTCCKIDDMYNTSCKDHHPHHQHLETITTITSHIPTRRQRRRHPGFDYVTKFAIVMTVVTLVLMCMLTVFYSGTTYPKVGSMTQHQHNHQQQQQQSLSFAFKQSDIATQDTDEAIHAQRLVLEESSVSAFTETADYRKYSCNYIYDRTPNAGTDEQCLFARTCNGGDGVWAPFVFCSTRTESLRIIALLFLSPVMILWLVLLFRLLGSTAEDYFSPALEMFSVKCNLPPRFAGVTLLALGNGAADVSATVAAITSDPVQGYQLSLGALTGAAMFISGVISAAVILAASNADGSGGLQCRGAFTRDVIALLVTVIVVYTELRSGTIGQESITSFLTLYCVFVCTVLIADVYHRAIVVPRLALYATEQERNRQLDAAQRFAEIHSSTTAAGNAASENTATGDIIVTTSNTTAFADPTGTSAAPDGLWHQPQAPQPPRVGIASKVLLALSNYDDAVLTNNTSAMNNNNSSNNNSNNNDASITTGVGGIMRMDDPSRSGWGIESETLATGGIIGGALSDPPIVLHGAKGLLNRHGQGHGHHPHCAVPPTGGGGGTGIGGNDDDDIDDANEYSMLSDPGDDLCVDSSGTAAAAGMNVNYTGTVHSNHLMADSWIEALNDGYYELMQHGQSIWNDIIESEDLHIVQKVLLLCELPFTIIRQLTVPIPCDGFYVRSVTAFSIAFSPLWFGYYLSRSHDYNLYTYHPYLMTGIHFFSIMFSLFILRYGPPTNVDGLCPMPLYLSVPIALYGFIMAATWIDTIADSLVSLLNFIGIILYIPGPVIGLTVLAWGNSMGDLSANMTMARKGLANMAITACFAGPVFNILVGLGLGFSSLAATTGNLTTAVEVSWSVTAGFIFLTINSCCILYTGLIFGKGFIPYQYGYVAIVIYSIYVITSISLQYSEDASSDE